MAYRCLAGTGGSSSKELFMVDLVMDHQSCFYVNSYSVETPRLAMTLDYMLEKPWPHSLTGPCWRLTGRPSRAA